MIRPATEADIEGMVSIGRQFYAASGYSRVIEFDPDVFAASLRGLLVSADAGVFVNESDGLQGMAAVIVYPLYMADGLTGQELFWWDEGGLGQDMRETMERWARDKGAATCQMSSLAGGRDEAMARMYRRNGYLLTEHVFVKEL